MMNPLYRKMFRDPMASRKPQGILASSAPMMTAAQKAMAKNQPMKAQAGASVNTQNYMSAIAQLTQQGDVQTLTNILQDTRLPTNVRTAARDAIGSLQPKPSVAKPTPSYFDPTLTRRKYDMNLQSSSPATPPRITGPLAPPQVGPPAAGIETIQGPPEFVVPGYGIGTDGAVLAGLTDDQLQARMAAEMESQLKSNVGPQNMYADIAERAKQTISPVTSSVSGAFAYPGDINKALDYAYPKPPSGSSPLDRTVNFLQRGAFTTLRAPYDVAAQIAGFGQETEKFLTEPYYTSEEQAARESMIAAGQSLQGRPFSPSPTPGLDILGYPGEESVRPQEVITPDTTDTGVGADMEDAATTEPSLTDKARTKLNDMLVDLETNDIKAVKPATPDVAGPKKFTRKRPLTIEEGTTPEATKIYEQVLPEKVSLSEVEEELKSQFDLDPSKYDEKKQNAFWMNVTMAGLAIAAGESDNALSNIAKGLMVGVDSYGKDLKDLNAQEREDQKEYRAAMRQLISDKRSENIAVAQMQNSWSMGMNQLNQQRDQFATEMEFNKAKQEWSQKMAGMQLTATITTDLAKLELQEETLDYTKTQDLLKNKLDAYMQSPEHVQTFISAGLMTIDPDTNMPAITTKGEEYRDLIIAAGLSELTTAEKTTDTSRAAAALTRVMLGQGSQNDISLVYGSYGEEIQEAGGLQQWIDTIPRAVSQTVPQTQNNNTMTQSGFTVIK